jgi:pyruvate/2-oxoglutarate dehydrogenase complex dihydrolipoamide acyltransferase (E2) component
VAQLILAQLSTSMEEASIENWLVEDGATVSAGQPIVVVMTDKVELELEAPSAGTVRIVAQTGDTVPVGAVIAEID